MTIRLEAFLAAAALTAFNLASQSGRISSDRQQQPLYPREVARTDSDHFLALMADTLPPHGLLDLWCHADTDIKLGNIVASTESATDCRCASLGRYREGGRIEQTGRYLRHGKSRSLVDHAKVGLDTERAARRFRFEMG